MQQPLSATISPFALDTTLESLCVCMRITFRTDTLASTHRSSLQPGMRAAAGQPIVSAVEHHLKMVASPTFVSCLKNPSCSSGWSPCKRRPAGQRRARAAPRRAALLHCQQHWPCSSSYCRRDQSSFCSFHSSNYTVPRAQTSLHNGLTRAEVLPGAHERAVACITRFYSRSRTVVSAIVRSDGATVGRHTPPPLPTF